MTENLKVNQIVDFFPKGKAKAKGKSFEGVIIGIKDKCILIICKNKCYAIGNNIINNYITIL